MQYVRFPTDVRDGFVMAVPYESRAMEVLAKVRRVNDQYRFW